MVHQMNQRGLFQGRVALVQPIPRGMADAINRQEGLYTVVLRGLAGEKVVETREVVTAVSRCIDPWTDFDGYLALARNPDLRFVVSNTTEAGIRVDPKDARDARPSPSFPGKLTQFLHERFTFFEGASDKGLVLLPCELIERNGDTLREAVTESSSRFGLSQAFTDWLETSCVFANTLVDRIVTGHPSDESEKFERELGYHDALLVAGESFHSWVIEAPSSVASELPLREAGLNVTWTSDVTPYRERKVRILNGAHTSLALAAFLAGKDTVLDCMNDPLFARYVHDAIHEEILPTLEMPQGELAQFADSVITRLKNPFIHHQLLSISLNSISKYRARILGTVEDYAKQRQRPPSRLSFALAALIAFYRGEEIRDGALIGQRNAVPYRIQDSPAVLEFFREAWSGAPRGACSRAFCDELVYNTLAQSAFWGANLNRTLPGFSEAVAGNLFTICEAGVISAIERLTGGKPAA
jgi:tagaturonate reductase